MPVVDGADVGIAGVGATLAGRVGDHDFGFGADVGIGFAESDGVVVGLGHFAAVEAGDAGGGGEERLGFFKDAVEGEEGLQIGRDSFEEIGEAHFEDALPDQARGDGDLFGVEFDVGRA